MTDTPVVLVTGASRGIGLGIATHFLAAGHRVAGCSRGEAALADANYHHTQLDVASETDVVAWVRAIRAQWSRIDVLVCNAGLVPPAQLLTLTATDAWERTMKTNVDGTFHACREAAKIMMRQRSGRIVTISSMAAALHIEGTAAYAASKAAVVELTKVLARELASVGVTCNTVSISMVSTDAVDALGPAVRERALEKLTFKRPLTMDEVCHAVAFLADPRSGAITGQVLQLGLVT